MTPDPQTATPAPPETAEAAPTSRTEPTSPQPEPTSPQPEPTSPRPDPTSPRPDPTSPRPDPTSPRDAAEAASPEPAQAAPAEPAQAATREPAETAVVTVPGTRRQEPRPSFWQRIGLRSNRLAAATPDDRLLSRLDAISSRIEASGQEIGERIRALDERFSEVWEVEEQLSRMAELRELLQDMRDRQGRVDGRLRGIERRLSFVTLLAAVAAGAALVAVALAWL